MPSSRGGGSFGGGGGHSFGGGSSGGGRHGGNATRFSNKPFTGARRYFYFNPFGVRCFFYYSGVPTRVNLASIIASMVFFIVFGIVLCALSFYALLPHKLSSSKCQTYSEYVHDASGIFSQSEEDNLSLSLEKFYNETGIQPLVYAVSYSDIPDDFQPISENSLTKYAYRLYVDTFSDEGHTLFLFAFEDETANVGKWVEMTGDNAQNLFSEDKFKIMQKDMIESLDATEVSKATIIAEVFERNIQTLMKPTKSEVIGLSLVLIFAIVIIILPLLSGIKSLKEAKQINEYCAYREANGGNDFVDNGDIRENEENIGIKEESDLFD